MWYEWNGIKWDMIEQWRETETEGEADIREGD
jgi:hypothetical protein